MIAAGALNKRVTFLVPQEETDSTGGELPLVDGPVTWGSIDFVSGNSRYGGATFVAEATHRITMRYRTGVLPEWQVRCQQTVFKILYIDNVKLANVQLDIF